MQGAYLSRDLQPCRVVARLGIVHVLCAQGGGGESLSHVWFPKGCYIRLRRRDTLSPRGCVCWLQPFSPSTLQHSYLHELLVPRCRLICFQLATAHVLKSWLLNSFLSYSKYGIPNVLLKFHASTGELHECSNIVPAQQAAETNKLFQTMMKSHNNLTTSS